MISQYVIEAIKQSIPELIIGFVILVCLIAAWRCAKLIFDETNAK